MLHSYTVQLYFNPRSRVGNDSLYTSVLHIIAYFNPRSRVGNDAESMKKIMDEIIFQSTFPRGERRKNTFDLPDRKRISIHVPAWGTTRLSQASEDGVHISIHVPAWGTTAADAKKTGDELFQSTFPRGERQQILTIFRLYFCIGITNLHFTSLLLSEFFILFISFVRFFKFFMVRVSLGFSVCF